jgi:hypothetical protein
LFDDKAGAGGTDLSKTKDGLKENKINHTKTKMKNTHMTNDAAFSLLNIDIEADSAASELFKAKEGFLDI